MAVENGPTEGLTESDDVRRRALLRLGVAGVVTATALAGLWWLDQGSGKPEKAAPNALPSPIVSAPPQASAPPQTLPEADAAASEPAEDAADATADQATGTPPGEPPSQPSASRPAPTPPGPHAPPRSAPHPAAPPSPSAHDAPPPPRVSNAPRAYPASAPQPPARAPAPAASGLGEPYLVRAGIFSDPARARELVERLNQQGIRAHLETRVHLGPFANREEAEKAQATLRKLGIKGVLAPAAATQ